MSYNFAAIDAAIPQETKRAVEAVSGTQWLGMAAIDKAIGEAKADYSGFLDAAGIVGIEDNFAKVAKKYGEAPAAATGAGSAKSELATLQARLRIRERQLKANPDSKATQAQIRILKRAITNAN